MNQNDSDIIASLEWRIRDLESKQSRYVENVFMMDAVEEGDEVLFWVPDGELVRIYHSCEGGDCQVFVAKLVGDTQTSIGVYDVDTGQGTEELLPTVDFDAGNRVYIYINSASSCIDLQLGFEIR